MDWASRVFELEPSYEGGHGIRWRKADEIEGVRSGQHNDTGSTAAGRREGAATAAMTPCDDVNGFP